MGSARWRGEKMTRIGANMRLAEILSWMLDRYWEKLDFKTPEANILWTKAFGGAMRDMDKKAVWNSCNFWGKNEDTTILDEEFQIKFLAALKVRFENNKGLLEPKLWDNKGSEEIVLEESELLPADVANPSSGVRKV